MLRFYVIRSLFDPTDVQNVTSTTGKTVIYHNPLRLIEEECILQEKKLDPDEYYLQERYIPENILEEDEVNNYLSKLYHDGEGDTPINISY